MSLKVDGSQAKIHWLSENTTGILTSDESILYILPTGKNVPKLGASTYNEMSPREAFESRYRGSKSSKGEDIVASHIFVVPDNKLVDHQVRELIHKYHKNGVCPFDALTRDFQLVGYNQESLIGFDGSDTHISILTEIIKEVVGLRGVYIDTREPITYRYGQKSAISKSVVALRKYKKCLIWAHTGFGKSVVGVSTAIELCPNGGLYLGSTPIVDTIESFKKIIDTKSFGRTAKISYILADSTDITDIASLRERANNGEHIFIILSVQDIRWKDVNDGLRKKYEALSDIEFDLWIRDERHRQYEGEITSEQLSNIRATHIMDMTATPTSLEEYSDDCIINRGLLWAMQHREHTKLPVLKLEGWNLLFSKLLPEFATHYTEGEGYNPSKAVLRSENGEFVYSQSWIDIAHLMYHSPLSKKKNPFSIVNDPDLPYEGKRCAIWKMPAACDGDSVVEYLPALVKMLNSVYESKGTYFIDSYTFENNCPKNTTFEDYMEQLLAIHDRVVILTYSKFVEGTDIPQLGHLVKFCGTENIVVFEQTNGRPMRVKPWKHTVKIYNAAPNTEILLTYGRHAKESSRGEENPTAAFREYVDMCTPIMYDANGAVIDVSSDEICDITNAWYNDQISKVYSSSIGDAIAEMSNSVVSRIMEGCTYKNNTKNISVQITDDNNSIVSVTSTTTQRNPMSRSERTAFNKAINLVKDVVTVAGGAAFIGREYDIRTLLRSPIIQDLFDRHDVHRVIQLLDNNGSLESDINSRLQIIKHTYAHIDYSSSNILILLDKFFSNTVSKKRAMCYLTEKTAREFSSGIFTYVKNPKQVKRILVFNALTGSLPITLRELYPDAEIYCYEVFDSFIKFLNNLGFKTLTEEEVMNMIKDFDLVAGNSPYQEKKPGNRKSTPIWPDFVEKAFSLCKPGGYVALMHPSGWRNVDGDYAHIKRSLLGKNMLYLEMHDKQDGLKTFGAATTYDWYVVQNTPTDSPITTVKQQDGTLVQVDLTTLPMIPAGHIDGLQKLVAKNNEPVTKVLYSRSAYGTDKKHMSETQTQHNIHPCVNTVRANPRDELKLNYSSKRDVHFGTPKLIWGNGGYDMGSYADINGDYGLTQFAYAIIDSPKNLPYIKQAFDNPEFREMMRSFDGGNGNINWKIIAKFKKDWWKHFV